MCLRVTHTPAAPPAELLLHPLRVSLTISLTISALPDSLSLSPSHTLSPLSFSLCPRFLLLSPARSSNAPVPSYVPPIHPREPTPETRQIQMHPHTNGANGTTSTTGATGAICRCREERLKPCLRLPHQSFRCEPLHWIHWRPLVTQAVLVRSRRRRCPRSEPLAGGARFASAAGGTGQHGGAE